MMKLPILPCAEKLELVLSTAPKKENTRIAFGRGCAPTERWSSLRHSLGLPSRLGEGYLSHSLLPQISIPESVSDLPGLTLWTIDNSAEVWRTLVFHAGPKAWKNLPYAIQEITESKIFYSVNWKRFCLNTRSLHCDSFLPLVTLGVSVGQLELDWIEFHPWTSSALESTCPPPTNPCGATGNADFRCRVGYCMPV